VKLILETFVIMLVFFCGLRAFSWSPPAASKKLFICCLCSLALAVWLRATSKAPNPSGVIEGSDNRTWNNRDRANLSETMRKLQNKHTI
jgi:uncharacterized membrane protein YfcA